MLAAVPSASQPPADRDRFAGAAAEFVAAQRLNDDRPEARVTLGAFLARRGSMTEAEAEYRAALRLDPRFGPAAINLADLYRRLGREADGEAVLRAALSAAPRDAALHHALGLTLVRLNRAEALEALRQAVTLAPEQPRLAYVYAVGLHSAGRIGEAMTLLKDTLEDHPVDRDILQAVVAFSRDAGEFAAALGYAERLAQSAPDDPDLAKVVQDLRRHAIRAQDR